MESKDKIWELKETKQELVDELVTKLDISPITAQILVNRGYDNGEEVENFLDCSIDKMYDPYLLNDMEKAVKRIKEAVAEQEKIVIYGDYDVDGITSTSLLIDYLQDWGAQVEFYIPNRLEEGYGLNEAAVRNLASQKIDLMITVDCGIKAQQKVELANKLGLDVIITDHHTVSAELPEAVAVINPKRKDSTYPFADLAGVLVAFKLVQALELERQEVMMPVATRYLALVTLGVVADIVPLRDENRIIVNEGLRQLQNLSKNEPGLFALAEVTGCLDTEISTGYIAFGLAPRINACGRLGEPNLGVELFLSSNYEQAQELAERLDDLNDQRQQLSQDMQEDAEALIEQLDLEENWVLVLASENWHSGVIGNVASDLNEKYHRPVILIAIEEGDIGKGSARSISGFNIHNALLNHQDLLIAFGGHEQAAGLSIAQEKINSFRNRLNKYAKQKLKAKDLIAREKVDAAVELEQLSFSLVHELNALAPFGCANPSPKLIVEGVKISNYKLVGQNEDHLKLTAQDGQIKVDGIAFSQPEVKRELDVKSTNVSLLFNPEINCWQGQKNLQLKVKDIKVPFTSEIEQLFARNKTEQEKELGDNFIPVIKSEEQRSQEAIGKLEIGEEVKLLSQEKSTDNSKYVEVVTEKDEVIGYLPDGYNNIARKLDIGVNYRAIIAEVFSDEISNFSLKILIKQIGKSKNNEQSDCLKEIKNQIADKSQVQAVQYLRNNLYDGSSSELITESLASLLDKENTLSITNPCQNKGELFLSFSAWQSIQHDRMSILIYPFKSILEERFPVIAEKLNNLGLQVCQATSSLTDSGEIDLKSDLVNDRCDLLVTTPQFLSTDLVNLEELSSQLGLLMIEEVDHFINGSLANLITEIITKLGDPLLLATTSSITKLEITKLMKKFNFDNQVLSNYNKAPLNLNDKRNNVDKENHLKQLLAGEEQIVVYVNEPEKSEEVAQNLRDKNQIIKDRIAFYHQNLRKEEQALVRNKFISKELEMIIATPYLNEVWGIKNVDQVVFYEPCFNNYDFKYLANQAVNSKSGELHLLYNFEEVDKNRELLKELLPNRELLKELYIILFKNKNKAGKITISQQELLDKLNNKLKFQINKEFLIRCLNIFAELDLIQRTKGKGGKIKLLDKPEQKLDLCSSMRYNECVVVEEVFSYLEDLAIQERSEILNSITETYSTTLKGERDIEFSR